MFDNGKADSRQFGFGSQFGFVLWHACNRSSRVLPPHAVQFIFYFFCGWSDKVRMPLFSFSEFYCDTAFSTWCYTPSSPHLLRETKAFGSVLAVCEDDVLLVQHFFFQLLFPFFSREMLLDWPVQPMYPKAGLVYPILSALNHYLVTCSFLLHC